MISTITTRTLTGGVDLYIKTSLTANCRNDMTSSMDNFETVWVEISSNRDKIMVGVAYRHPNNNFLAHVT